MRELLTHKRFREVTAPLIGLRTSLCWRGYGTAIFLELGPLRNEPTFNWKGEFINNALHGKATVMIEWSWRVEGPRMIRFGSWNGERKITNGVRSLMDREVLSVSLQGRLPELVVQLSGNLWVHSFATVTGQPEWTLFLRGESTLFVDRGVPVRETSSQPPGTVGAR